MSEDFKIPKPHVRATVFEVCCLPMDHPGYKHFVIYLKSQMPGYRWAIMDTVDSIAVPKYFGTDGAWSHADLSPEKRERWETEHYFEWTVAETLAKAVSTHRPLWSGITLADAIKMHPLEDDNGA